MKKVNDMKENKFVVRFCERRIQTIQTNLSSLRGSEATEAIQKNNPMDCHDLPLANLAMTESNADSANRANFAESNIKNNSDSAKIAESNARRIPQIYARGNRAAFGMIFAIILTIIVAGLGILGLKFSAKTLNTTTNEYIAIQLDLYLNSTAELAILYAQRNGFICAEGADCDLGPNNISGQTAGRNKRQNPADPIEKYIEYGANGEYKFNFKMTPFDNYDEYDARVYMQSADLISCKADVQKPENANKRCYEIQEETKNAFLLDISGSVTNPITNQTLRVTKRQIIKP
ncbi:hypothetical protein ACWIUD_10460 [Helicobacter sp. 23-1044]